MKRRTSNGTAVISRRAIRAGRRELRRNGAQKHDLRPLQADWVGRGVLGLAD